MTREFLDSLDGVAFVTGDLLGSSAAAISNIWFPFAIGENDTMGRRARQEGRQKKEEKKMDPYFISSPDSLTARGGAFFSCLLCGFG